MIYLNNASTSYPKPDEVIQAATMYLNKMPVDSTRTGYKNEQEDIILACRKELALLFNAEDPNLIAFTSSATHSLNLVLRGLDLKDSHVVTTTTEHNSVIRPLTVLQEIAGTEVTYVECDKYGFINPDDIANAIRSNTKAIVVSQASNVVGTVIDIKTISKIAHDNNLILVVDASQSAGCISIDVQGMGIDVLIFTGHKSLYGIAGMGGAYIKEGVDIKPLIFGGTGIKSELLYQPEERPIYYESGTPNIVGMAALRAGVSFVRKKGVKEMSKHKAALFDQVIQEFEKYPEITIYGKKEYYAPLISFNFKGIATEEVGYILADSYDIAVRTGLHCAPLIHKKLGTYPKGTVRISFSCFTTEEDIRCFLDAIHQIVINSK